MAKKLLNDLIVFLMGISVGGNISRLVADTVLFQNADWWTVGLFTALAVFYAATNT